VLAAKGNVIIHAGGDVIVKGGPKVKVNPSADPEKARQPQALSGPSSGSGEG